MNVWKIRYAYFKKYYAYKDICMRQEISVQKNLPYNHQLKISLLQKFLNAEEYYETNCESVFCIIEEEKNIFSIVPYYSNSLSFDKLMNKLFNF